LIGKKSTDDRCNRQVFFSSTGGLYDDMVTAIFLVQGFEFQRFLITAAASG
jgi:hypothetical protein